MKEIRTEDAVGHILCHDITQIIKDVKKGVLFKKGHIVREEDIPLLLSVGKEHLPAEERQRKERGESRTAHGLPARTLRMRLRDFRRYHIAILCLGPDDFVDVVHDDFPLCEKQ